MKIVKLVFASICAIVLLSGCMTISVSKSLVVTPQPGETKIVVTGNAVTHCQDYFLFFRCTLNIEMEQAK